MHERENKIAEELRALQKRLAGLEDIVYRQQQEIEALKTVRRPTGKITEKVPPAVAEPVVKIKQPSMEADPRQNLEAMIGGTWLNRIGIVAFLFGIAFFLKYAFDNQWIGPAGRIMIGCIAGITLLALGELYQHRKYTVFAQGLTGGGIGTLYLTVFSAFSFYHLITQTPAYALMVLVTAAAVVLALRYDTAAIAVLGLVGGFATPVLISSARSGSDLSLFIYLTILNLGILAIGYSRKWHILNYLSFLSTLILFSGWASFSYHSQKMLFTQAFLTVFFIIYALLPFVHNILQCKKTTVPDIILILATAAAFSGGSYAILYSHFHAYAGFFAAALALFYFTLGYASFRVNDGDRLLVLTFWGTALTFITLAVPIQVKANWVTTGWALEAVILLAIGLRQKNYPLRVFAFIIHILAVFRLLTTYHPYWLYPSFIPFMNAHALTYLVVIATVYAGAYLYARNVEAVKGNELSALTVLVAAGSLLALRFLTTESTNYIGFLLQDSTDYRTVDMARQLTVSVIWTLSSIALVAAGILKKFRPVRLMGITLFGITILKVFFVDLSNLQTLYRIISFILLGVILILVSYMYQRYRHLILASSEPNQTG